MEVTVNHFRLQKGYSLFQSLNTSRERRKRDIEKQDDDNLGAWSLGSIRLVSNKVIHFSSLLILEVNDGRDTEKQDHVVSQIYHG